MSGAITFAASEHLTFREHDVILQTLDRESNGIYLTRAMFEQTVADWNGVPVIFAADHVEPSAYDADPSVELTRAGGKVVGKVVDAHIEVAGHPRLMARLVLDDAGPVETFIDEGRLSLSTAFFADNDGTKLTGVVRPHHVLLFIEGGMSQPGDKGAFILNKQKVDNMTEDKLDSMWATFKAGLMAFIRPADEQNPSIPAPAHDQVPDPATGMVPKLEAELADYKRQLAESQSTAQKFKEAAEAAMAKVKELEEKLLAFTKENKDRAWSEFKRHVPDGMVHGDKEATARAEWENDAAAFTMKVLQFIESPPDNKPEDGKEHTPPPAEPDPNAPYLTVEAPEQK